MDDERGVDADETCVQYVVGVVKNYGCGRGYSKSFARATTLRTRLNAGTNKCVFFCDWLANRNTKYARNKATPSSSMVSGPPPASIFKKADFMPLF